MFLTSLSTKLTLDSPASATRDRAMAIVFPVSLDAHHHAGWADELRRQHRDVANAGADVEHPLPGAYASVAEEALGERIPDRRLADQPGVFCACAPRK